jgi:hypothetical protein
VAERPIVLPPEFDERVMQKIRAYNAAAALDLTDYVERVRRLQRDTGEQVTATHKAIDLSQVFIVKLDALDAELTSELTTKGWLWPAYRSAHSEPEEAAQLLDRPQEAVAQFRDSAREARARAEKMRDPDARRMMRELAMHYEILALRVENATMALRLKKAALQSASVAAWNSKRAITNPAAWR